ncbi:pickpocket protein 19-like [Lucilia cuprina]|uniref:pickpocket protein 19-like n=1 Tax=Lucilia cuprina TaxID=7375 RepID=UPI001F06D7E1|nr:pickpocket protein 19-like [Lucilia cuprina]
MVAVVICLRFWNQFENQSTLPVYEMLEQGSKLPYSALYICLGYPLNPKRLAKYRNYILKPNLTMSYKDIDKTLQYMLRFQRSTLNVKYNLTELFLYNVDIEKLRKHFIKFYYQINELLQDCYIQGIRFDCSDIFIPLELAPGFCFIFNSIYTYKNFHENPLKVPYQEFSEYDDDWSIRFKISYEKETALLLYLKDPRNLLSLTDYPNYVWRPRKQISEYGYTIVNQYSEEKNRKLNLKQRKCIFSDEKFPYKELNDEFATNFYDQDVCYNYCHTKQLIKLCNCTPTFSIAMFPKLANKTKICRVNDISCYETYYLDIRRHECKECLSNCNRTTYVSIPEIQEPERTPILNSSYKRVNK